MALHQQHTNKVSSTTYGGTNYLQKLANIGSIISLPLLPLSIAFSAARSLFNPNQEPNPKYVDYSSIKITPLNLDNGSYTIPYHSQITGTGINGLIAEPVAPNLENSVRPLTGTRLQEIDTKLDELSINVDEVRNAGGFTKMEELQKQVIPDDGVLTKSQENWLLHYLDIKGGDTINNQPSLTSEIEFPYETTQELLADHVGIQEYPINNQPSFTTKIEFSSKTTFKPTLLQEYLETDTTSVPDPFRTQHYLAQVEKFTNDTNTHYGELGQIVSDLGLKQNLPNLSTHPELPEIGKAFIEKTGDNYEVIIQKRIREIVANTTSNNQATVLPGSNVQEVLIASGVSDIPTDYGIINHTDSVQGANNIADNIKQYVSNAWQAVSGTVEDITKFTTQSLEKVQDFLGEEVCQAIGENLPAISCAVSAGLSAYQAHQACKNNDSEKKSFGKEFEKYFCPDGKVLKVAKTAAVFSAPLACLAFSLPHIAAKVSKWRATHLTEAAEKAENEGYVFEARELEAAANLNKKATLRFEKFNQGVSNFGNRTDKAVETVFKKAEQTTSKAMASIGNNLRDTGEKLVALFTGNNWGNEL
jgi:hypothetical protein